MNTYDWKRAAWALALVTATACRQHGPVTLVEDQAATWEKYGVHGAAHLKKELEFDLKRATRHDAWLLSVVGDMRNQLAVWREIRKRDPRDLEAALTIVELLNAAGRLEEALRELDGMNPNAMILRDKRARRMGPTDLLRRRCAALRGLKRYPEARDACQAAIDAGAGVPAEQTLTKILVGMGDVENALAHAERLVHEPHASRDGDTWYTYGLILEVKGRQDGAHEAFRHALRMWPSFTPAAVALREPGKTVEARQDEELRWQSTGYALQLAHCWHYYTELGFGDRAQVCAEEADEVTRGRVDGQRVYHLAESDAAAAVRMAEGLPKERLGPDVFAAHGWALGRLGRDAEAKAVLERGLELDSCSAKVLGELLEVCERLGDRPCVEQYERRLYTDDQLRERRDAELKRRVVLGSGGAFLVGVLALVRVRVRRRRSPQE
ncbi:MAG: hypothetical protein QM765_29885 [Myxococcales bacterium]